MYRWMQAEQFMVLLYEDMLKMTLEKLGARQGDAVAGGAEG